jgi:D-sedoheptulose 7-phosphate isomerase
MNSIKQHFSEAADILSQFLANDKNFEAIEAAGKLMVTALQNEKKIISCGNGGSLCDAMHFAEELTGRYRDDRKPFAAISISKNVLNAMEVAKRKGIKIVGLTGKDGGKMNGLCDVEIRAPYSNYADRAQEIHIKCIHSLIDFIERTI